MVISIAYPVADITIFFLVAFHYDTVVIIVGVGDRAAFGEQFSITEFDEKVYTDSIREEGRAEGREEGIKALIIDNLEEGKSKKIIIGKLVKRFELQEKAAIEYFDRFADNSVSKL